MKAQQNPGGVVKPDFYFFARGAILAPKWPPGKSKSGFTTPNHAASVQDKTPSKRSGFRDAPHIKIKSLIS